MGSDLASLVVVVTSPGYGYSGCSGTMSMLV